MNTRRDFLSVTVKGSAMAMTTALMAGGASAASTSDMNGSSSPEQAVSGDKQHYKPPFEKRKRLRTVASNHGVDLRTAALQFSAAPDTAAALVVGASSEQQILADYTSMQTKIPAKFWAELKTRNLIEQNAPVPA